MKTTGQKIRSEIHKGAHALNVQEVVELIEKLEEVLNLKLKTMQEVRVCDAEKVAKYADAKVFKSWHKAVMNALASLAFFFLLSFAQAEGTHCSAKTKAGEPCKMYAQKGANTCFIHNPANKCEGKKKDGTKCNAAKINGSKFCGWHQPK